MKKELRKNFENAVEDYCKAFCKKYELEDYSPDMWVGDHIGGIIEVSDYFFNFDDVKYCIDNDVDWMELTTWYDYCIELKSISSDLPVPNLDKWIKGCTRLSADDIIKLNLARKKIDIAEKELKNLIEEYKSGKVF